MGHTHIMSHTSFWAKVSFTGDSTMDNTNILTCIGFFSQLKLFFTLPLSEAGMTSLPRVTLFSILPHWGPGSNWHFSDVMAPPFGLLWSKEQVFLLISIRPNWTQSDPFKRGGCEPMTSLINSWNWRVWHFPWVLQTNFFAADNLIAVKNFFPFCTDTDLTEWLSKVNKWYFFLHQKHKHFWTTVHAFLY